MPEGKIRSRGCNKKRGNRNLDLGTLKAKVDLCLAVLYTVKNVLKSVSVLFYANCELEFLTMSTVYIQNMFCLKWLGVDKKSLNCRF